MGGLQRQQWDRWRKRRMGGEDDGGNNRIDDGEDNDK